MWFRMSGTEVNVMNDRRMPPCTDYSILIVDRRREEHGSRTFGSFQVVHEFGQILLVVACEKLVNLAIRGRERWLSERLKVQKGDGFKFSLRCRSDSSQPLCNIFLVRTER